MGLYIIYIYIAEIFYFKQERSVLIVFIIHVWVMKLFCDLEISFGYFCRGRVGGVSAFFLFFEYVHPNLHLIQSIPESFPPSSCEELKFAQSLRVSAVSWLCVSFHVTPHQREKASARWRQRQTLKAKGNRVNLTVVISCREWTILLQKRCFLSGRRWSFSSETHIQRLLDRESVSLLLNQVFFSVGRKICNN